MSSVRVIALIGMLCILGLVSEVDLTDECVDVGYRLSKSKLIPCDNFLKRYGSKAAACSATSVRAACCKSCEGAKRAVDMFELLRRVIDEED